VEANIDHEIVQILDSLYIESRYPVDVGLLPDGKPTQEDADKFFGFAILIYRAVKKKLEWKTFINDWWLLIEGVSSLLDWWFMIVD